MKSFLAIALSAMISCTGSVKKEARQMPGAYTMLSQSVNDGKTDTTYTTLKQLKIYTGDYMMYANTNPADSISAFGIGTYSTDTGGVKEDIIYNAADTAAGTPASYNLVIENTPKGYKQVIPEIESGGQKFRLTEEYDAVGTTMKSPLDGAWKQIKSYTIKGKDSIVNNATQFKTYYAGHFIFGHTWTDSTNKLHTGMGYGIFAMNGANKVKETVEASAYYEVRGKSFDIDIELTGTDEFKQTITETNGDKGVEIYQRLKK